MADQVAALQQSGVAAEQARLQHRASRLRGDIWRRIDAGDAGPALPLARRPDAAVDAGAAVAAAAGAGGDRRGALRQPVGPRLPPRVPHAGPAGRAVPERAAPGRHRHRRRPHARGHPRRAAARATPREFVDSFARPELALSAERKRGDGHERVLELVAERPGRSGVVYAGSRDGVDKLAEKLRRRRASRRWPTTPASTRTCARERLEQFLEADAAVMVATIAFGMGVDKPDVRYVIHADPPAAIEAYWQEIGRAGRDGAPAEGITLYSSSDLAWALRRIDSRDVDDAVKAVQMRKVRQLYAMLDGIELPRRRRAPLLRRGGRRAPAASATSASTRRRPPTPPRPRRRRSRPCTAWAAASAAAASSTTCSARPRTPSASETGLSTCGIGRELSAAGWRDLLDQLLFEGLLREDPNDGRPLIGLGEADAVRPSIAASGGCRCASAAGGRGDGRPGRRAQAPRRRAAGHRARPTRRCSRRCAPGAASAPPSSTCRPTSSSTTPRSRPSPASGRPAPRRWPRSAASAQSKLKRYGADVLKVVRENTKDGR